MAIRNIAKKIRKKLQKGFTLVEIMVTIAIVGLLAALIFVGAQSALSNGRDSRRQGELSQVKKSLQAYYLANGNQYPLAAEAISLEEDNDANGPFAQAMKGGGYLPIIPRDPKHNVEADYSYKYIATTTAYYTLCAKSESKGGYLCVSGETGVALEDDAPAFGSWGGGSEEEVVVSVVPQISAGGNHTCFVKSNGTVWCWGNNSSGELGINNTTQQLTPVQVLGAGGSGYLTGVSQIMPAGHWSYRTCAVKSDSTVWCWGDNSNGQLGINNTTQQLTPVQVLGAGGSGYLTGVSQVVAGHNHLCALKSDGTVWCWGSNNYGQLGINNTTQQNVPVQVLGAGGSGYLTGVSQVTSGWKYTCALKTDGTVLCWGVNDKGQLGINNTTQQLTPVQVLGAGGSGYLTGVSQIMSGAGHICTLKTDGTVWCWGGNYYGQLGINNTTNQLVPVQTFFP